MDENKSENQKIAVEKVTLADPTVEYLCEVLETDVNRIINNDGDTGLIWSVKTNKPAWMRLFLQYQANENLKDNEGKTALWYANHNPDKTMIVELCAYCKAKPKTRCYTKVRSVPVSEVSNREERLLNRICIIGEEKLIGRTFASFERKTSMVASKKVLSVNQEKTEESLYKQLLLFNVTFDDKRNLSAYLMQFGLSIELRRLFMTIQSNVSYDDMLMQFSRDYYVHNYDLLLALKYMCQNYLLEETRGEVSAG